MVFGFARFGAPDGPHRLGIRQNLHLLQQSLHSASRHDEGHHLAISGNRRGFFAPEKRRKLRLAVRNAILSFHVKSYVTLNSHWRNPVFSSLITTTFSD